MLSELHENFPDFEPWAARVSSALIVYQSDYGRAVMTFISKCHQGVLA